MKRLEFYEKSITDSDGLRTRTDCGIDSAPLLLLGKILSSMDTILIFAFRLHDWMSAMLTRYYLLVKKILLFLAHLSLFGFLFPELRRNFGSAAEIMLLVILFLSPLSKILGMRLLLQLMGLRRELGIIMGYLALVHGLGYLTDPDWSSSLIALFQEIGIAKESAPYFFGILAFWLTLPLLLTSNAWAQRTLGGIRWKRLHRLVYVILPLVLLHHFSMEHGFSVFGVAQAVFFTAIYFMMKVLAWKNVLPPLRQGIEAVSARYRAYTLASKEVVRERV